MATILVTGVSGNLGRPLAKALAASHDVVGLARFTDAQARADLEAAGVQCVPVDLGTDPLDNVPGHVDYVVHAAALIPMRSEIDMARTFAVNTQATGALLARYRDVKGFVFCSAAAVYRHQPRPLVEEDDYGAYVPAYAMSKIAAEQLVIALSSLWSIPSVILRVGALYGPDGGTGGATAPIDRMLRGKDIWVNPAEPREVPLLWEADAVQLMSRALEVGRCPPLVVNLAGDEQAGLEEYCTFAGELVGVRPVFRYTEETYPANPLDTTRMHQILGHCPTGWQGGIRSFLARRAPDLLKRGEAATESQTSTAS